MKNKSIYLIYDTVRCTPNGDPDTGEQRYNEITKKAPVTDLRIKRFGRDKLNDLGVDVYYFYDKERNSNSKETVSGALARYITFCKSKGIDPEGDSKNILLENFIDVRLFGGVLPSKNGKGNKIKSSNVTGALQFDAENDSINEVIYGKNLINRGITTIFPSKDSNNQGSMGRDTYLRYGLFDIVGFFSATTAKYNGTTDEDLKLMIIAIWDGMKNINTRSKFGHNPIAFIVVEHPTKEINNGFIGKRFLKTFKPFEIKTDVPLSDIYCREDYEFDFTPLKETINDGYVDNIVVYCEDNKFIQKHFSDIQNCTIINPFDVLFELI